MKNNHEITLNQTMYLKHYINIKKMDTGKSSSLYHYSLLVFYTYNKIYQYFLIVLKFII